MNIRDLHYFLAVHDLQHYGKAASVSCVSQPALSMQLKKLEDELGVQLFERTNKRVMTTPVGHQIAEIARNIVMNVDTIKQVAKTAHCPYSGTFKIGAFPTLAPYLFPKIVPRIKRQFPDLTLLLIEEKTQNLISNLTTGKLDAALVALPISGSGLDERLLFSDPFYLAVPNNHRFTKLKSISQKRIANETLWLLDEGHCLREQALSFCSTIQAKENNSFRASSLETLRQMIASGVGITLIPKIAMRKNDGICYIPFSAPAPSRDIGIVWRKNSYRAACIAGIADVIVDYYTQQGG